MEARLALGRRPLPCGEHWLHLEVLAAQVITLVEGVLVLGTALGVLAAATLVQLPLEEVEVGEAVGTSEAAGFIPLMALAVAGRKAVLSL
jgi:hypothetical protein